MSPQQRAHVAMAAFSLLVATSFSVGGIIASDLDPVALTFVRFLIATAIFAVILVASRRFSLPSAGALLRYGWLGFLLVVFFVTMFEALRLTTPVGTGVVFALTPILTAGFSYLLLRQKISPATGVGLVVAGMGTVWVVFGGNLENLLNFSLGRGEAIFLVGAVSYAAYSPFVRRLHSGENLMLFTFWTLAAGAVLLGVYGGWLMVALDWGAVPAKVYFGIIYLAVFTTAVTFYLIKFASLRLPSAKVMAYTYLVPGFVVVMEGALGHGWPDLPVLAGVVVTGLAMAVVQTG
ncbi:MAG: DMT family transporter [Alphaproteobacteria bacterium]